MNTRFAPLSASELKLRYGKFFRRRRKIDPKEVPEALRGLVCYAELWGVADDYERERLVDSAPPEAKSDIVAIFSDEVFYSIFSNWLGHPESTNSDSEAYQGFADFGLCYHSTKALLDWAAENKS